MGGWSRASSSNYESATTSESRPERLGLNSSFSTCPGETYSLPLGRYRVLFGSTWRRSHCLLQPDVPSLFRAEHFSRRASHGKRGHSVCSVQQAYCSASSETTPILSSWDMRRKKRWAVLAAILRCRNLYFAIYDVVLVFNLWNSSS